MRMDYFSDLVEQSIDDSKVEITGDGSKFEARVISDSFDGVSTIKRHKMVYACLLYTSPSPRDLSTSRMPSSA